MNRIFTTVRVTINYFRQLKRIWIKGQPEGELITYADVLKARDQAKLTLEGLLSIREERERIDRERERWN